MTIKRLKISDTDKIIKLQNDNAFSDGWNKEMFVSFFENANGVVYGALEGDNLIGFISLTPSFDSVDINDILVDKDKRKMGVGKSLIDYSLSNIKNEKDLKSFFSDKVNFFLEVRKSNKTAKSFYLFCGFNKLNERQKYYSDGETAEVFFKEI